MVCYWSAILTTKGQESFSNNIILMMIITTPQHSDNFIPQSHPRAKSLLIRKMLVNGHKRGLVVPEGLIAHGRGEAFDYLMGERTSKIARIAIKTACAALLSAKYPVISINGNVTALCAKKIVELAYVTGAKIEVNLFYRSERRERLIKKELQRNGAKTILGVAAHASATIPELQSNRRRVDPNGILKADVVLVALEDGDRTEALRKMNKKIIAIDLNPLSRTATSANITIVDNVIRAIPEMIATAKKLKEEEGRRRRKKQTKSETRIKKILREFNNTKNLYESLSLMRGQVYGRR